MPQPPAERVPRYCLVTPHGRGAGRVPSIPLGQHRGPGSQIWNQDLRPCLSETKATFFLLYVLDANLAQGGGHSENTGYGGILSLHRTFQWATAPSSTSQSGLPMRMAAVPGSALRACRGSLGQCFWPFNPLESAKTDCWAPPPAVLIP